jgi:DNA-binding transcriptional ArsR family regulator
LTNELYCLTVLLIKEVVVQNTIMTTMAALGDPTRFAIVERLLREGEVSAGDLAGPFSMSKPAISRHLKVLENAELIERRTEAQFRVFRARADTFKKMDSWLGKYRKFWEASFDRLEEVLNEMPDTTIKEQKSTGDGDI